MSDEYIVNTVRSTRSGVHGRSLNSAGHHHFVIDGPNLAAERSCPVKWCNSAAAASPLVYAAGTSRLSCSAASLGR